jgi:uncharacterized protein (TIGR03437 family)
MRAGKEFMFGKTGFALILLSVAGSTADAGAAGSSIPSVIQNSFQVSPPGQGGVSKMGFDAAGNLYLAGTSLIQANDLSGATVFGPVWGYDVIVIKISASHQQVDYVTVIGCGQFNGPAGLGAMAVDTDGNVFLAGAIASTNYPSGQSAPTVTPQGAFLLKLDPSGQKLLYASPVGAPPAWPTALVLDSAGNAYVGGNTSGYLFDGTPGAYQFSSSNYATGFVSKFDPNGQRLAATLFGSPVNEHSTVDAMAVDSGGVVHLAGHLVSAPNFPLTQNAAYPASLLSSGAIVGYLARLNSSVSQLLYSTPLPFIPSAIAVDAAGASYVAGSSIVASSGMVKIDSAGGIAYSVPNASGNSITVRDDGSAILAGSTNLPGFPTRNSLQACSPNLPAGPAIWQADGPYFENATLMMLDAAGNITFSTLLGGSGSTYFNAMALDPDGNLYITGYSSTSEQFSGPVLDASAGDWYRLNDFVFQFDFTAVPQAAAGPAPSCLAGSADLNYAPAAPGMLATLFGDGIGPASGVQFQLDANGRVPTEIAGVSVTVGGLPAPLLYVQNNQVNFVVPQQVTGESTNVCVTNSGRQSCLIAYVTASWPQVFQTNVSACNGNCLAVLNQDYSLNTPSNPAAPGSVIMIFGTGFGPINSALPDGSIVSGPLAYLATAVTATFPGGPWLPAPPCSSAGPPPCPGPTQAGIPAAVLFAGAAPGEVLGVDQIDVLIPDGVSGATYFGLGGTPVAVAVQ